MDELGLHELAAPVRKGIGEAKELHESRLEPASTVLDVHAYVDDFNGVVDAYRRGVADVELPSEPGVARSVIPPGTAATRDFSGLAPRIPEFMFDACVGCMACVNACPDTAILGVAQPGSVIDGAVAAFVAGQPEPAVAAAHRAEPLRPHDEVRGRAGRRGLEPGPVRDLRRPGPLQGLRGVRRGLRTRSATTRCG